MSRTASALTEEAVLPTLHNLILAEVYLAGGPVNLYRLWSEMFERQKTIDVGTLLFGKAFFELEDCGYLQKISEMKSGLTGKGEMYLMALLLAGNLSDEALVRLAEGGITLASTGNILDVSARGNALPYEGRTLPAVTRDCPNRGRDLSANSSAANIDVADQATGNAPVTDGLQVGDEGVSGGVDGHALESGGAALPMRCGESHFHSRHKNSRLRECPEQQVSVSSENQASPADSQFPTDERYADNISRFVDSRLERNGL